jgi:hypothetical protein
MPEPEPAGLIAHGLDGHWCVCVRDGRLVFIDGDSRTEIPIDAPLRWTCDGAELSFEAAIESVPEDLHGWVALAATIALRECVAGLVMAIALPWGHQEWIRLAARAAPAAEWMLALARLDAIDMPALPDGIDDGFGAGEP